MLVDQVINHLESLLDTHEYTREVIEGIVHFHFDFKGNKVTFKMSNITFCFINGVRVTVKQAFDALIKQTYKVISIAKNVRTHGFYKTKNRGILLQSIGDKIEKFWVNQTNLDVKLNRWDVVTADISIVGNFAKIELV